MFWLVIVVVVIVFGLVSVGVWLLIVYSVWYRFIRFGLDSVCLIDMCDWLCSICCMIVIFSLVVVVRVGWLVLVVSIIVLCGVGIYMVVLSFVLGLIIRVGLCGVVVGLVSCSILLVLICVVV